jgi:hypothetical protein
MSAEKEHIPDWALQEWESDLAWIRENLDIFELAARLAFVASGRGVIVVDTTAQPTPGAGHPFGYFGKDQIDEEYDEDTKRMVQEYDPHHEFVLALLKKEDRISSYRVQLQRGRGDREASG